MKDWAEGGGSETSFHFGRIGDSSLSTPDTNQRVNALTIEFSSILMTRTGMPSRSSTLATTVCKSSFSVGMSIIINCPCDMDKCQ